MKAFVAVLALVAAVAGDVSIQKPDSYLQPPVEHHTSKDFNAPWVQENPWRPAADPHQPIHVPQQSFYYNQVQHGDNNRNYQHDQHQYQPHQQTDVTQQSSYDTSLQHGNNNQEYHQEQHQYQPHQQTEVTQQSCYDTSLQHGNTNQDYQQEQHQYQPHQQQSSYYAPVQNGNNNQDYQQQHHHHQEHHQQQQGHFQTNNAPSSVAVQVTHPDWATSFSNVNRYNTYWPATPVVPFVPAAPVFAAPAPFSKPTQAPVAVYNNNVAKWNPWNSNQYQHQHSHDIAKVPLSVAKYVAITPGSIHIAPLPGHTVSHKVLNLAPAGSW